MVTESKNRPLRASKPTTQKVIEEVEEVEEVEEEIKEAKEPTLAELNSYQSKLNKRLGGN